MEITDCPHNDIYNHYTLNDSTICTSNFCDPENVLNVLENMILLQNIFKLKIPNTICYSHIMLSSFDDVIQIRVDLNLDYDVLELLRTNTYDYMKHR